MAQTMEARLRSGTAQAQRAAKDVESQLQRMSRSGTRVMKGIAGDAAGLAAALRGIVKLLDTVYQRRQAVSSEAANTAGQQQPTGAQRNREIADRARRLFRQSSPAAPAPAEEHGRTAPLPDAAAARARPASAGTTDRAAQALAGPGPQSGESGELPPREPDRFADIPGGRGAAVVHIGTYYGYKPNDAATNTETRTGD